MQELEPLLRELAAQLGVTTEYLWTVLVDSSVTRGVIHLVIASVLAVAWLVCVGMATVGLRQRDDNLTVAGIVLGGAATVPLLFLAYDGLQLVLLPEYTALQQILALLR